MLKAAWALVRAGWCRNACSVDSSGREVCGRSQQPVAWSLYGALSEFARGIEAEYARRLLRRVLFEHDLVAWNNHPVRTKRDVLRAIERAIAVGDGLAIHRGGWRVGAYPQAKEPKRDQEALAHSAGGEP